MKESNIIVQWSMVVLFAPAYFLLWLLEKTFCPRIGHSNGYILLLFFFTFCLLPLNAWLFLPLLTIGVIIDLFRGKIASQDS
jgi:hypothetical protein